MQGIQNITAYSNTIRENIAIT